MLNRRGPLAKLVGGAIGVATEYNADRKERKAAKASESSQTFTESANPGDLRHNLSDDEDLTDDEAWAQELDNVAQQAQEYGTAVGLDTGHTSQTMGVFTPGSSHPSTHPQKLSMPVIIPQRRPGSKNRGFIAAYAPILEQCDVDQGVWLKFLDGFEKSIKQNGWFNVLNVAVMGANMAEMASGFNPLVHLAATAVHASIEVSRRAYINFRQNNYLDAMNDSFFKPRGLYCLIISYKPSSAEVMEPVDLTADLAAAVEKRDGQSKWKHLQSGSAYTSKGELAIPEPAPLVFPQLDSMSTRQKENFIKHFGSFLGDYYDRAASARFAAENPYTNIPQAPQKEFASVWSDPNSAASKGGFFSIATGGKVNETSIRRNMNERRAARKGRLGITRPSLQERKEAKQEKKKNRPMKSMLKQDTVYLMVLPMPLQEEINAINVNVD